MPTNLPKTDNGAYTHPHTHTRTIHFVLFQVFHGFRRKKVRKFYPLHQLVRKKTPGFLRPSDQHSQHGPGTVFFHQAAAVPGAINY